LDTSLSSIITVLHLIELSHTIITTTGLGLLGLFTKARSCQTLRWCRPSMPCRPAHL